MPATTIQTVDAASLFWAPGRHDRPSTIVVLIRGIPGSGKSWLAQRIRNLECEHGAKAPRVLSIDPYFMIEDEGAAGKGPAEEVYQHDVSLEGTTLPVLQCIVQFLKPTRHSLCSCCRGMHQLALYIKNGHRHGTDLSTPLRLRHESRQSIVCCIAQSH